MSDGLVFPLPPPLPLPLCVVCCAKAIEEEDAGGPDFQPSQTFAGRKAGFEFKTGTKGLGYYRTKARARMMGGGGGGGGGGTDDDGGGLQVEQQEVPDSVFGALSKMEGFTGRARRSKT